MRMSILRSITSVSFFATWCATVVSAAEPVSVDFRAVYFDPGETTPPVFYMGGKKAGREHLDLDKSRLSDTQNATVREGRMVDFFLTKEPQKDEKPAVSITLPQNFQGAMLVVLASSATSYQAWAIPLPPNDFPAGGNLLINISPSELAFKAGNDKPIRVLPSKHQFLKAPAGLKDDMMPIQIFQKTAQAKDAAWQIVQSTRWAVDRRFRSYVFFYQPDKGRLMMHGISERLSLP